MTRFSQPRFARRSPDGARLGYHALVLRQTLFSLVVLCGISLAARESAAKENGFPTDSCSGCHKGGETFKPRVTIEPARIAPGQSAVLSDPRSRRQRPHRRAVPQLEQQGQLRRDRTAGG